MPAATGVCEPMPPEQASVVQGLLSSLTSVLSFVAMIAPLPSHSLFLQSPGSCIVVAVPAATLTVPHAPAMHVAVTHSLEGGGQSPAVVHTLPAPPEPELLLLLVAPPAPPEPEAELLLALLLLVAPPAPPVPLADEVAVAPPLPPAPPVPPVPPAPPPEAELEPVVTVVDVVDDPPPPPTLVPVPPEIWLRSTCAMSSQPAPPRKSEAVNQRMGSLDARMNHPAAKENPEASAARVRARTSDETPGASTPPQRNGAATSARVGLAEPRCQGVDGLMELCGIVKERWARRGSACC
jgi:hypothetical protein